MPTVSGPLFNGGAARELDRAVEEIAREIGKVGEQDVQARLRSVLRHPTGKYQRRIRVASESSGLVRVDDQRSVYGPWLEGTGSRNARTRFKGYATFRKTLQQLDRKAGPIAERIVARVVGGLR